MPARIQTYEVIDFFELLAFFGITEDSVVDDVLNAAPFSYGHMSVELITMYYVQACGWLKPWVNAEQFDLARLTFFQNAPAHMCFIEF